MKTKKPTTQEKNYSGDYNSNPEWPAICYLNYVDALLGPLRYSYIIAVTSFICKSETQINSYDLFAVWTLGFNFSRCWGYFVKNSFFTIRAINGYTDFITCQFSTSISIQEHLFGARLVYYFTKYMSIDFV